MGTVGIISAGTSDEYVVNEAYYCLQYLGIETAKIQDVGVAGIHRLIDRLDYFGFYVNGRYWPKAAGRD